MSSVRGVFGSGNVLHVQDLVDWVSEEEEVCEDSVGGFLRGEYRARQYPVDGGDNVKHVVPGRYFPDRDNRFYLRSMIVKNQAELTVTLDGEVVKRKRLAHVQSSEELSRVAKLNGNRLEVHIC